MVNKVLNLSIVVKKRTRKYSQAIDPYTQAIELNSQNAVYFSNHVFAHLRLEEYGSAIHDATEAIDIDPKYSKGYYRWGAAHLGLGKFKEALKDFQQLSFVDVLLRPRKFAIKTFIEYVGEPKTHLESTASSVYRPTILPAQTIRTVFHTYDYARHFISACTLILGLESTPFGVEYQGELPQYVLRNLSAS
ncbi:Serine/threonine-protein phosphatase 5, partial [Mucuna pruriens]